MNIVFIQTGGTIDKGYPKTATNHGYNFENLDPAIKKIFAEVSPLFTYTTIELLRKDSLDITPKDRKKIVATVRDCASDKIVITHGTDTMHITAEAIAKEKLSKTIVLTGSNLPFSFKRSDAQFNVGQAVGGVQVLPHGVYIALNGLLQPWDEYRRQA
jgi:L-asparaginase